MKLGSKDFSWYWKIIKIPVLLLVLWSVLAIIIAKISIYWFNSIFSTWSGLFVQVVIFSLIGIFVIKDHKGSLGNAAWAGASAGVIAGFLGGILGIIMMFVVPEIFESAIQQAIAQGMSEDVMRQGVTIWTYAGVITGPIVTGIFGTIISTLAGLITKKTVK
ncbi:MAG: hypothetical protein KJ709_03180 [Nanoarchaeota archaeon]|nr:hypothetical protein [Nanoarchaeota archaeon]